MQKRTATGHRRSRQGALPPSGTARLLGRSTAEATAATAERVDDPIPDRETKLAQRNKIKATIAARIEEAKTAAKVACGEPRRIGWAHVVAVQHDDEEAEEPDPESEAVAMRLVTSRLTAQGWKVTDVHTEGHSYDLYAERGSEQRCVEAKGLAGNASSAGVRLTGGELAKASQLGDEYWLYVVENCFDGEGRLYAAWQNPAETFRDSFIDVPIVRLRA